MQIEIKGLEKALQSVGNDLAAAHEKVLQVADAAVRNALDEHFMRRQREPRKPILGFRISPQGFWFGHNGFSVRERIQPTVFTADSAIISIDSPALARKLNPNPPPILPKKGKYLAIPLNDAAASRPPRSFDLKPGRISLSGLLLSPKKRTSNTAPRTSKLSKGNPSLPVLVSDSLGPCYLLVRRSTSGHDPRALPSTQTLISAISRALSSPILPHLA